MVAFNCQAWVATVPIIIMPKIKLSAEELDMIQKLRKEKKQKDHSAVNANSDNNSNAIKVEIVKPKRTYTPQPVYVVIRSGRKTYLKQVDKRVDNKIKSLEGALGEHVDLYPDKLRFEMDFKTERDRLTDSIRFNDSCKALGLVPEYVADHVVFEGKRVVERVLKEGLQVVGEKVHMFNAPLWKDTQGLYGKTENQNVESQQDGSNE